MDRELTRLWIDSGKGFGMVTDGLEKTWGKQQHMTVRI